MSKTRNKSTADFPSGISGSGSGGSHFRDKSDTRIQVGLETTTATDTLQGSSDGYKKL